MERKHQAVINRLSLEQKVALCSGADYWTTKPFDQAGIPSIRMTDGPHGLRKQLGAENHPGTGYAVPATCFPTASLTACSWDPSLLHEMGVALAEEALQEQVSIILGPGTNIKRNPLCGRNFEYFSEDPLLAGEMASAWIQGVQSLGIGVSLKHFAANNQENVRLQSNSIMDDRALREIYLTAFEIAVKKAHPATIMCAYNQLNGTYCSDNNLLLREILRDEWGFTGVIVTDWGAMHDRILAYRAGLDLEMPGGASYFDQQVVQAVRQGHLSEDSIDDSVDRLLDLIFTARQNLKPDFHYDPQTHHQLARKVASQSAVLLKNDDHALPLKPGARIALIGALAEKPRFQGAGSSFIRPTILSSALQGFDAAALNYTYYPGYQLNGTQDQSLLQQAVAGARQADIAVIFAGLTDDYEAEGFDRTTMTMPETHNQLIQQVASANPNTVVVLVGGSPVELPWALNVKAIINMYLSGQAGGLAAVDLLTGAVNPSGKLAETYPLLYSDVPSAGLYENGGKQARYHESIYVGYRYYDKAHKPVAFPFGHGLSYTTFEYSDLIFSRAEMTADDDLTVTAKIRNTGEHPGAEVVQLYVGQNGSFFRPEKELKGFQKIHLTPGEEKQVSFTLSPRAFSIYHPTQKAWQVPAGTYTISLASSSRDVRLQAQLTVNSAYQLTDQGLPAWYLNPVGQVTQSDFEKLLGQKIPALIKPRKGEYTMTSNLRDMQDSPVIQFFLRMVRKNILKQHPGVNENDPNLKMAMESAVSIPIQSLALLEPKSLKRSTATALVHLANGRFLQAIKALFQK